MDTRVTVGVGSKAHFVLHKLHARMVSLSGMQPKFEAVDAITGTITKVDYPENNETTPEGKPNYRIEIKSLDGHTYKIKRADIKECYSFEE